jgi:hypothetical protein
MVIALAASAHAQSALMGTWKLNAAKSKFEPGPAPKSQTLTYSMEGDKLKIVAEVVGGDGAKQTWTMVVGFDGKPAPITGNPNADTVTLKKIDERTGESTFTKGGKVMAVNTRVLSADGKTLTITTKGTDAKGQARHDVQVFEK